MRTTWYIAKKDLLQTLKDRNSFLLLLAVPLTDEVRGQLVQRLDEESGNRSRSLAQLLHALCSTPEFQLA